jgi:hypothetical protein
MFAKGLLASVVAWSLIFAGAPPAQASQTSLTCNLEFTVNISPGVQLVDSFVQTGTLHESLLVTCVGEVDGTAVDPAAGGEVLSFAATTDDQINCATVAFTGDGGIRLRLFGFDGSPLTVEATFGIVVVVPTAVFVGELDGPVAFEPIEGDCVIDPLTRVLLEIEAASIEV